MHTHKHKVTHRLLNIGVVYYQDLQANHSHLAIDVSIDGYKNKEQNSYLKIYACHLHIKFNVRVKIKQLENNLLIYEKIC